MKAIVCWATSYAVTCLGVAAQGPAAVLQPRDVFELEFASDPQIAPAGDKVVYVRNLMDVMADRRRSNLWCVAVAGGDPRPLTTGARNDSSPRWSPDGRRLAYVSTADGSAQIYLRWMDTGQQAKLTQLPRGPSGLAWSPDGKWLAFSMLVPEKREPFAKLPAAPKGATWAAPPVTTQEMVYRHDGQGYLEDGHSQLFVLSADGGTPRQVTTGDFNHRGTPSWSAESDALIFSANRHEDWQDDPRNTEVYEVALQDGAVRALTTRFGPDDGPVVSPDGQHIAYLGFDDRRQGYQVIQLYVMARDGSAKRALLADLDRDAGRLRWRQDSGGIYFQYDDEGRTKVGWVALDGTLRTPIDDLGGTSLGRPYSGGSFSVARDGTIAYTCTDTATPADVAVRVDGSAASRRLTALNDDLLAHKELAEIDEFWCASSFDDRRLQGWVAKPPGFDPQVKYPLILEIHGGPFANYGARFAAEMQLYAAAGYVVLYLNPRGSTGYGGEFGNLIHHNYPGEDYHDLMSAVDAVVARGHVDTERLFVTGGSGGGVLTAWIVGKTRRFRAAVVAKPVINWYSFVLTSDSAAFFWRYWFPGFPWDHHEHYYARSPLSLVGQVETPTMLLTGEQDYRTPIAESEQYYQALRLRGIDTMLVRVPGASHGIAARPSQLMAKVVYILEWFKRHDK